MFFYGPLHMDVPVLGDQQEITNSSTQTLEVVWNICRERWMIGKSVLSVRLKDDDNSGVLIFVLLQML